MANEQKIGTYHLGSLPNIYTPAMENNFEFVITGIDGIRKAGMLPGEANSTIANAQETLRVTCDSSAVPHFSQGEIAVKRGNNTIYFPGTPTFETIQVRFKDYIGSKTKDILMGWQAQTYNTGDETVGTLDIANTALESYKKRCYLIEYTPDFRKIRQWVINGAWITNISENGFDNNNNNQVIITATLRYDSAWIDYSAE